MERKIIIYDTLSRKKREFVPIVPGMVGLYVCGPTVYGDPHLGHARPAVTFDVLVRLFRFLGYKVRYVRNITDVGHLEHDADAGEDKIEKKARLEQLEPMEVAQYYENRFHEAMRMLNTLPPSIEPHASGHIIEQIALARKILDNGFAYVSNGSVYFDVRKYNEKYHYGILSGRNLDDMINNSRTLAGQEDKHSPVDFALWKKASAEHIMRWPSPWSDGFPGWHAECSAMSEKYLGKEFDIHGGGMDLVFPHHECELAQNTASRNTGGVHYWMHNNMITINGQKMGKSLGNFITLDELFHGTNKVLSQAYSPMTIRFFILEAHYRSTLDFGNDALQAAEKGMKKISVAAGDAESLSAEGGPGADETEKSLEAVKTGVMDALCDDLNTPVALAGMFDAVKIINNVKEGRAFLNSKSAEILSFLFHDVLSDILGIVPEGNAGGSENGSKRLEGLVSMVLRERKEAKDKKDWAKSDSIRDDLNSLGINIKDTKDGTEWNLK
ncbi:MAG: cysteine--tRNA ligase [Bacteroidales bacterium]|jgi:cysteinyl-tRNA synthetase|nr:cysteine--tRNA ligase [Bacteroidales bacterium]